MSETKVSERYLELRIQFEKFTKRSLTEKELKFIKWLSEKNAKVENKKLPVKR